MVRSSFFVVVFVAVVSVFLFSGQVRRPYAPPQQSPQRQAAPVQQRQQAPQVQRQVTPPRPETPVPSNPAPPATEMPSLFWLPEDINFPEMPPGASRTVTLFGDPRTEGLYVTRTLIPHGAKTMPHTHPDSRTVTVLSGVCYYGRGEEFDESLVIPMPPGSFFTEPAGIPHYIWAKDGDVIVQTTGIGPSGTQIIPARRTDSVQGR